MLNLVERAREWHPIERLQQLWHRRKTVGTSFFPEVEIRETRKGWIMRADVPGMQPGDIDITLTGNLLTVHGEREDERDESTPLVHLHERTFGSFTRAFTLPDEADPAQLNADLTDGVLTVVIPRSAVSRRISVTAS